MRRSTLCVVIYSLLSWMHQLGAFQQYAPILSSSHLVNIKNSWNAEECHRYWSHEDSNQEPTISRRDVFGQVAGAVSTLALTKVDKALAADYIPSKRPTAYKVDSTIPPTLLGLSARREFGILKRLGKGSGTRKESETENQVNLNNILNKAVFGSINRVRSAMGTLPNDKSRRGPGYASFVCLGIPQETTTDDISLAASLVETMVEARKRNTEAALGLAFAPLSAQPALDAFIRNNDKNELKESLSASGVPDSTVGLYEPLFMLARREGIKLLALSPEMEDIRIVRSQGLQNVNLTRREQYVIDIEGFIGLTQDKRFRLYTDRSLMKDFVPINDSDKPADFFAERILVHETAATVATQFASVRPDSLVIVTAPTPDVRYLCGINGRILRLCGFLNGEDSIITDEAVTTIILNPTAKETLSLNKKLRLEIGTSPENLDVQTKIADYLWFAKMPRVNLIPRLMSG